MLTNVSTICRLGLSPQVEQQQLLGVEAALRVLGRGRGSPPAPDSALPREPIRVSSQGRDIF